MPEVGTQYYIGDLKINKTYIGEKEVLINPFEFIGNIPQNGLVSYYTVNNTTSWPGSGTTWYDLISGSNMIPVSSSVFPTYDATANAFNFNKTNNALFGEVKLTSITTNQSHVWWVKPGGTGAVDLGIYGGIQNQIGGGVSGRFDGEGYGNQGTGWTMASSNADRPVSSGDTETVAEFVNIIAVRDSTSFRLYRNGVEIGSTAHSLVDYSSGAHPYVGSNFLNNTAPEFGGGNWGTAWFTGSLSSYAIYNRALNTNEITNIYNLGKGRM
jgi:hypothetical protein